MLCTNTLASSCEMRANTDQFFFSEASCKDNVANYGRAMIERGYGVVPSCFKVGDEA